jgi:hypothetical protein
MLLNDMLIADDLERWRIDGSAAARKPWTPA